MRSLSAARRHRRKCGRSAARGPRRRHRLAVRARCGLRRSCARHRGARRCRRARSLRDALACLARRRRGCFAVPIVMPGGRSRSCRGAVPSFRRPVRRDALCSWAAARVSPQNARGDRVRSAGLAPHSSPRDGDFEWPLPSPFSSLSFDMIFAYQSRRAIRTAKWVVRFEPRQQVRFARPMSTSRAP